jgi:hypothetical protein
VDGFILKIANRGKGRRGPAAEPDDTAAIEDDASAELADILGVADEDKERFGVALKDYVKACMMRQAPKRAPSKSEEDAEGEDY